MSKFQLQFPIYVVGQVYESPETDPVEISRPLEISNGAYEVIPVFQSAELASEFLRRVKITGYEVVQFFQPVRLLVMLIRAKRDGSKLLAFDPVDANNLGIGMPIDSMIPTLERWVANEKNLGAN